MVDQNRPGSSKLLMAVSALFKLNNPNLSCVSAFHKTLFGSKTYRILRDGG